MKTEKNRIICPNWRGISAGCFMGWGMLQKPIWRRRYLPPVDMQTKVAFFLEEWAPSWDWR